MKLELKDFMILESALPETTGHIDDDRALELMNQGYIKYNPKSNWYKEGYTITKEGRKLYNEMLNEIRERHGHEWFKKKDDEEFDGEEEDGEKVDYCAMSEDFHNGPMCKKCDYSLCEHSQGEWDVPKCSKKGGGE